MTIDPTTPAIAALIQYADDAPEIECGEGFWDDMESAKEDGFRQAQSSAAVLIRDALISLGIAPPKGRETCPGCYQYADQPGRGIDHHHQCEHADDDEDDEDEDEDTHQLCSTCWDQRCEGCSPPDTPSLDDSAHRHEMDA